MSKLTVAFVRDVMNQMGREEITFSRMVELLNQAFKEPPRRNSLDKCVPAELAIYKAMEEVEKLPASSKLTDAIVKLSEAKELVADYIDFDQYLTN